MRRFPLITLMLCFGLNAGAQIMIVPREKLEAVHNPRLSDYAGFLDFNLTIINAPTMNEDDGIKTFTYPFTYVGKDTLDIKKIVSTCSCAAATCRDMELVPGKSSEIVVRYNPKGHPGRFERKVFVYLGEDSSPAAVLRLSVNVESGSDMSGLYPVSMGDIRLRRTEVNVCRGVKAVENCVFVNVSDRPLRLECERMLLPKCLDFKTEPEVVAPGAEGEILITYDPSRGGEKARMPVIIKGLGVPPSQSAITVNLNEK